jgi:hypothetical protein
MQLLFRKSRSSTGEVTIDLFEVDMDFAESPVGADFGEDVGDESERGCFGEGRKDPECEGTPRRLPRGYAL